MILIDTGAIYAILDKNDANHKRAVDLYRSVAGKEELVLLSLVLVETWFLLDSRLGSYVASRFISSVNEGIFSFHEISLDDISRAIEIEKRYKRAKFGLIDSVCFAFAERKNIREIFTFDNHFSIYKPNHVKQFNIYPF